MNGAEVLTKFTADTSQVNNATDELTKNFQKLQKIGEVAFVGLTTAANAFAISVIKGGIEYNSEIETYMTRLETLTGSMEDANKVLEQIKKDALSTPFDVSSLTQAESLLISTGLSAEEARQDILALGDAVAASGGGNAELQRMAVNLQQIKNVGKASSLDIKQFAYAGIDIYGLLADSMGVTREEASKLDVSYEMLSKALQKASKDGGKYYGAMEKQSKTMAGATSNLKESWNVLKGELAEGVFNAVKDLIPKLTELLDWLGQNKDMIIAITLPTLTFLNTIMGLMAISKVTSVIIALFTALMAHPFMLVVGAITALVVAFTNLWNHCDAFRNFFIGLWETIKTSVQSAWLFIQDMVFDPMIARFTFVLDKVIAFKDGVVGAWEKIKEATTRIFDAIGSVIKNTFNAIGEIIKTPINAIIDAINKVLDSINKITIPDWVPGIGGSHTNFKHIERLATGTNYVPQDMVAMIHEGEAVVPKKFNPYANGVGASTIATMGNSNNVIVNIENNMEFDALGQLVNNVKTFSGGAKNDYNYGMGR